MSGVRLIPPGGGEVIGDAADRRVEILSDDESLNATWSRFAAGREGADLHVHRQHTDLFYVLSGELTVRLGSEGREARVPSGSLARVPPMVVHGFRNASEFDVTYLNFHAPGRGFSDYMRSIRDGAPKSYDQFDPPADGGRDPSEAAIGSSRSVVDEPGLRIDELCDEADVVVFDVALDPEVEPNGAIELPRSFFVLEGSVNVAGESALAGAWVEWDSGEELRWSAADRPARVLAVGGRLPD